LIKNYTYKTLSCFLLYPNDELKINLIFVNKIIKNDKFLSLYQISMLNNFILYLEMNDLAFLQEYYVSIFDRRKDFSLYLFEHIHGDSRDRGMAMIDLKNLYRKSFYDLSINNELPDYLPVFLEYLSLLPQEKSCILLNEIYKILNILCIRLKKINSIYYIIFFILLNLINKKTDNEEFNNKIALNDKDIDKDWEEPKVFD
jgi:nitrate reductase molybdenum cofactor assembly chaperone NarJ/NarW